MIPEVPRRFGRVSAQCNCSGRPCVHPAGARAGGHHRTQRRRQERPPETSRRPIATGPRTVLVDGTNLVLITERELLPAAAPFRDVVPGGRALRPRSASLKMSGSCPTGTSIPAEIRRLVDEALTWSSAGRCRAKTFQRRNAQVWLGPRHVYRPANPATMNPPPDSRTSTSAARIDSVDPPGLAPAGVTSIAMTHDMASARRISDQRILMLHAGRHPRRWRHGGHSRIERSHRVPFHVNGIAQALGNSPLETTEPPSMSLRTQSRPVRPVHPSPRDRGDDPQLQFKGRGPPPRLATIRIATSRGGRAWRAPWSASPCLWAASAALN